MGMNMWLKKGSTPITGARLLGLDKAEKREALGFRERMRLEQQEAWDRADGLK